MKAWSFDSHPRSASDRRKNTRYDTSLPVIIRTQSESNGFSGSALDVGANGMKLLTSAPLFQDDTIFISFESASNNTQCEARVVWCQQRGAQFESGVDIQRWLTAIPGENLLDIVHDLTPKKDRRRKKR